MKFNDSRIIVEIDSSNGYTKAIRYPNCGHDAWTLTYKNREVFEWLLSHKNKNLKKLENLHKGAKQFG